MNKLNELISKCKVSVDIAINSHRGYYSSVKQDLFADASLPVDDELTDRLIDKLEITMGVFSIMISKDTIIRIQFFPRATNGSYTVYHHDLEKCLDQCLDIIISLMDDN